MKTDTDDQRARHRWIATQQRRYRQHWWHLNL